MGFNSGFKGLNKHLYLLHNTVYGLFHGAAKCRTP